MKPHSVSGVVPAGGFCNRPSLSGAQDGSVRVCLVHRGFRNPVSPAALDFPEFNMKKLSIVLAVAGMVASLAASAAVRADLLGDPSPANQAQRTIVITPTTKYVNVTEGDVVRFVVDGQTFVWNFDGSPDINSFPLNRVAPAGVLDHTVTAYVARNMDEWD
jgi:hypothetical protein